MNEDTLHLLSECAAGTDMAIRSLDDVLKNSPDGPLQRRLASSKRQHESLAAETKALLCVVNAVGVRVKVQLVAKEADDVFSVRTNRVS